MQLVIDPNLKLNSKMPWKQVMCCFTEKICLFVCVQGSPQNHYQCAGRLLGSWHCGTSVTTGAAEPGLQNRYWQFWDWGARKALSAHLPGMTASGTKTVKVQCKKNRNHIVARENTWKHIIGCYTILACLKISNHTTLFSLIMRGQIRVSKHFFFFFFCKLQYVLLHTTIHH